MAHFVVIGGGLAGLTAANALAGSGAKVTLLEQSRSLGGRARTRQEGGHTLNLGPHALYRGGIAARTFLDWGDSILGRRPWVESVWERALYWYVGAKSIRSEGFQWIVNDPPVQRTEQAGGCAPYPLI